MDMGKEPSVTTRFANQFKRECLKRGMIDLTYELAGQDNKANADAIFNALDNFTIIEFKSDITGIEKENRKARVYSLCHALQITPDMEVSHNKCHYIMWGEFRNEILETECTIYQASVCRKSILKESKLLGEPTSPKNIDGKKLASQICDGSAGLGLHDFLLYLQWLFSESRGDGETFKGPVSLIGTSSNDEYDGRVFKSFDAFRNWAEPTVNRLLNNYRKPSPGSFNP